MLATGGEERREDVGYCTGTDHSDDGNISKGNENYKV